MKRTSSPLPTGLCLALPALVATPHCESTEDAQLARPQTKLPSGPVPFAYETFDESFTFDEPSFSKLPNGATHA